MPTRTRRPTGPFGAATRAARSGAELTRLATRTGEMMLAAGQTIDHRTGMLRDAWGDPVAMADPEFTLMASEKVDAFWRSHGAMSGKAAPAFQAWMTWFSAQARINMSAMTALSRCRSPQAAAAVQGRYLQSSAVNAGRAAERLGRLGVATAALGLAPVHKAATANAKRLLREEQPATAAGGLGPDAARWSDAFRRRRRPIQRVDRRSGSCLGAAYVAAVGAIEGYVRIGEYVALGRTFAPDPAHRAAYDRAYGLFRETYERLRTLYPALA